MMPMMERNSKALFVCLIAHMFRRGRTRSTTCEAAGAAEGEGEPPKKASIQVFVKELKKKLEKSRLQDLVKEVRAYKDRDSIDNLLALLRTFKDEKLVDDDDLRRFQPFVRRVDEAAFTKLFYS